jgi:predicted transcriptional regulator
MSNFDRWVSRCSRRINFGEFLRDAADWLAGFCFVFGIVVLAVKLRWPDLWPEILWLVLASLLVTGVAWRLSRRRQVTRRDTVAFLDQRLEAGGLLMTLSELPAPEWTSRLPQLESLWQEALPRLRPSRFVRILVLPVTFACATCFVPLREFHEPTVKGAVSQQNLQRLEELLEQLEEAEVIKPNEKESEQLKNELQKLAEETKEKPLTHEKWATVDALQERLKARLEHQANLMFQAAESLAMLSDALQQLGLTGETSLSDDQLQQLESEVAKALQELAKGGVLERLNPDLQQRLGEMARQGQFRLPKDAVEREAIAAELQKFLDQEAQKLAELRAKWEKCHNPDCEECNKPGGT